VVMVIRVDACIRLMSETVIVIRRYELNTRRVFSFSVADAENPSPYRPNPPSNADERHFVPSAG